ncbi:Co2+/Mg2+ efflux protein ApaG [Methylophilaceae bacterium]|jgi:ApaG protein|nr:Co2+/Mg2+ efflux protein ApaG [Methylophilaceae bacterium]|tara:strand:+ start:1750 stop:2145 length:396 start_codon:yes stop_codon:yes gene_type:complete
MEKKLTSELEFKVLISVQTEFIEERSFISANKYFFSYTVTIENHGTQSVQLISRHWIINNAHDEKFEVKGEGVVGEQPTIQPGEIFSYSSGTEIDTPLGNMLGTYHMVTEEGISFDAKIPKFELNMPRILH